MEKQKIDLSKEYGIVLEGGGAKGAYQIGVWKALKEANVKIKAVAGVSAGALNGALICMDDYELAEEIWSTITYSSVIEVDDINMGNFISGNLREMNLNAFREDGRRFIEEGGFGTGPLKKLISRKIDEKKIKESDIEFILGTFSVTDFKEEEISSFDVEEGMLKEYLMASASFPLFQREKVKGKTYIDGGVRNNLPIDMLIKRGYKDIITIRIFGIGIEKRVRIPNDVNLIEIAPQIDLGRVLEFDRSKASKNIAVGYHDAQRVLQSLAGVEYYIRDKKYEHEYLAELLSINDELYETLRDRHKEEGLSKARMLTEVIYPKIANALRLYRYWTYGDLYYAIIESSAKKFKIPIYHIYSNDELFMKLLNKIEMAYDSELDYNIGIEITKDIIKKVLTKV